MTFNWRFIIACLAAEAVAILLALLIAVERAPAHSGFFRADRFCRVQGS